MEQRKDEWEQEQIKSFSAWANFYLQRRGLKCENLTVDFCDGTLLIALVEELSGKPVPFKYLKKPKLKIQKLENASLILTYMKNVLKIRLTGIGAEDIVNGNIKYLLGMTWSVARHFNLAKAAGNPSKPSSKNDHAGIDAPLVDEIGQLSVGDAATAVDVPSPRYDPEQERAQDDHMKYIMREFINRFLDHPISDDDLVSALRDGTALCDMIRNLIQQTKGFSPDELHPSLVQQMTSEQRIDTALGCAEKYLSVPSMFSGRSLASGRIDPRTLMLFLSLLQNAEEYLRAQGVRMPEPATSDAHLRAPAVDATQDYLGAQHATYTQDSYPPQDAYQQQESYNLPSVAPVMAASAATTDYIPPVANEPMGGEWINGVYVVSSSSSLQYRPFDQTQEHSSQVVSSGKGKKNTGILAFGKRLLKEAQHEWDKVYSLLDDTQGYARFNRNFLFRSSERLYGEFPAKFWTNASGGDQVIMIGYIYVTENYLAFSGERATGKDRISVLLSLLDIDTIDEGITPYFDRYKDVPRVTPLRLKPGSSPNALLVHDKHHRVHEFLSITSVSSLKAMLSSMVWHAQQRVSRQTSSTKTMTTYSSAPVATTQTTVQYTQQPPPVPTVRVTSLSSGGVTNPYGNQQLQQSYSTTYNSVVPPPVTSSPTSYSYNISPVSSTTYQSSGGQYSPSYSYSSSSSPAGGSSTYGYSRTIYSSSSSSNVGGVGYQASPQPYYHSPQPQPPVYGTNGQQYGSNLQGGHYYQGSGSSMPTSQLGYQQPPPQQQQQPQYYQSSQQGYYSAPGY